MNRPVGTGSGSDPGSDEDSLLLVRARTRPACFGEFYDRHVQGVLAFFYQRTRSAHVAADLTAETFTIMLAGLHRFRPARGTGRQWMFGIATNLYRQWVRRGRVESNARRKLGVTTPHVDTADIERIEAAIDFRTYADALPRALEALSPNVRNAVQLRIHHQLPYREIAAQLGCTEVSARVRVSRGLDRLLDALEATP